MSNRGSAAPIQRQAGEIRDGREIAPGSYRRRWRDGRCFSYSRGMIRLGTLLLALFAAGGAFAQPTPRLVLDADLPLGEGRSLGHNASGPSLAIGADGMHYVLQHQYVPGTDSAAKAASLDVLALTATGTVKFRRSLPVQAKMARDGFALFTMGIAVTGPGDVAVFVGPRERDGPATATAPFATLLRLGADGTVKTTATLDAPRPVAAADFPLATYNLRVMTPTSDNALLLGGGFGNYLHGWWIAKVGLDGAPLWRADGGKGQTAQVSAAGPRPNGAWMTLSSEAAPQDPRSWSVRLHAANGKLLAQHRGPTLFGFPAAVLRQGAVLATNHDSEAPTKPQELVFIDDAGKVTRRVRWPFPLTHQLIADGDGFAGIVSESLDIEGKRFVVRADKQGKITWRADSNAAEIVRTPDGHIAALARSGNDGDGRRLVRFADP